MGDIILMKHQGSNTKQANLFTCYHISWKTLFIFIIDCIFLCIVLIRMLPFYSNAIWQQTKIFPWLGCFEGKVSSADKTKAGKVFTIKYKDNNSKHWSIEDFADYSSKARIPIGGLYFGLYKPFKDPQDDLVQHWLKYLIAAI